MTPNQLSTLDFANNLLLNGLNMDDKSKMVYDFSGGYNVLDFLITRGAKTRQIDGEDGVFQKPIMGRSQVIAQVASTVVVGPNLQVTFTDPTYDNFRVQETVTDGTAAMNQGRVVAKGPGFIVLEPAPPITTWDTALHFVAGSNALAIFVSAGNRGSTGVQSLYEQPFYVRNQTSIIRESVELFRRDMFKTWVEASGKYWYSAQDMITAQRYARSLDFKALWSNFGQIANSSVGGAVNYSMGLKASIQDPNRGGIYQALTNPMTQNNFENWIGKIADRQAVQNVDINILCGRGFLNRIQSFTTPFIQFAGKNNTFGGESVKGLDVRQYAINGINVNFVMMPLLNDIEKFPTLSTIAGVNPTYSRMAYTAIALDTSTYDAVGGGGNLPAMEKVYFGSQETIYGYIPGLIGQGATSASSVFTDGKIFAANDRDAVNLQIYSDCAYDFMSYRMGWLELAN